MTIVSHTVNNKLDSEGVPLGVDISIIRYDDGDFALRFGEFSHSYQMYFNRSTWMRLIHEMTNVAAAVDPDEELCYYGDSEIDPNPPEED